MKISFFSLICFRVILSMISNQTHLSSGDAISVYHAFNLYRTDTSIMESCCVQNVFDKRVRHTCLCVFLRICHVSTCRVLFNVVVSGNATFNDRQFWTRSIDISIRTLRSWDDLASGIFCFQYSLLVASELRVETIVC